MSSLTVNTNSVEFVSIDGGEPRTTTLAVAKKFGKRHTEVLRAARNIDCSDDFRQRNFASADYVDAQGKKRQMFSMTKDGFVFLVMGFTGKAAAEFKEWYIGEFNRMTEHLNTARFAHIELQIWQNKEVGDKASGAYHGKGLRHRRDTKQENHENIKRLGIIVQPMLVGFEESLARLTNKDGK